MDIAFSSRIPHHFTYPLLRMALDTTSTERWSKYPLQHPNTKNNLLVVSLFLLFVSVLCPNRILYSSVFPSHQRIGSTTICYQHTSIPIKCDNCVLHSKSRSWICGLRDSIYDFWNGLGNGWYWINYDVDC